MSYNNHDSDPRKHHLKSSRFSRNRRSTWSWLGDAEPESPNSRTYVGSGKLEEIADLRLNLHADVVVFDDELSPAQLRNVENALEVKVIDRPTLILDIFARRAFTHEGRLQVELAQLEYLLPRLTVVEPPFSAAVGGVGTRGPGETQLEVDRRRVADTDRRSSRRSLRRLRAPRAAPGQPCRDTISGGRAGRLYQRRQVDVDESVDAMPACWTRTSCSRPRSDRQASAVAGRWSRYLLDTVGFIHKLPTQLIAAFTGNAGRDGDSRPVVARGGHHSSQRAGTGRNRADNP